MDKWLAFVFIAVAIAVASIFVTVSITKRPNFTDPIAQQIYATKNFDLERQQLLIKEIFKAEKENIKE